MNETGYLENGKGRENDRIIIPKIKEIIKKQGKISILRNHGIISMLAYSQFYSFCPVSLDYKSSVSQNTPWQKSDLTYDFKIKFTHCNTRI